MALDFGRVMNLSDPTRPDLTMKREPECPQGPQSHDGATVTDPNLHMGPARTRPLCLPVSLSLGPQCSIQIHMA